MKQMARSGEDRGRTRQKNRQCSVVIVDVYQLFLFVHLTHLVLLLCLGAQLVQSDFRININTNCQLNNILTCNEYAEF